MGAFQLCAAGKLHSMCKFLHITSLRFQRNHHGSRLSFVFARLVLTSTLFSMSRPMPPHFSFRPVVRDQHTAARAYFLCVLGMLVVESMLRLPGYLLNLRKRGNPPTRRSRNHWAPYVALHKLLTQPSPAPFLTSHHVASIGRCLVFVGLNILWGWNRIRFTTDYQVYGWLTIANAGLALLLPTRTNLFSLVTRIPAPILLIYHRWAGVAAVIHASLHFGLTAQKYVETNQFDIVLQNTRIRIGILAWAALCVMFLTSLRILRRRTFELFYYTHFLFLVFVAGALYHAASGPEFLLPGLCLWAVDRAVRFCYSFRRVAIQAITHHAGGVVKLKFEGVKTTSPAQMAWIQLPGVSRANWHPFTIASAPGSEMGTIAIRALGGYTKKVQSILDLDEDGDSAMAMAMATDQASPCTSSAQQMRLPAGRFKMRLDGPYGVGRLQWTRYPIVVIVAGGIGITPGISIAAHVVKEAASRACFRDDRWEIHLLWSLSERSHASWFEEDLKKLVSLASRPDVPVSLDISIHVTGRKALEEEVAGQQEHEMEERAGYAGPGTFHKGRPDLMRWFQHIREGKPGRDAAVSVCGPQSLKDNARRAAARASSKEGLFFVEEEVFEF